MNLGCSSETVPIFREFVAKALEILSALRYYESTPKKRELPIGGQPDYGAVRIKIEKSVRIIMVGLEFAELRVNAVIANDSAVSLFEGPIDTV